MTPIHELVQRLLNEVEHGGRVPIQPDELEEAFREVAERARDWTLRVVMKNGVEQGMMDYADDLITPAKTLTAEQLMAEWS